MITKDSKATTIVSKQFRKSFTRSLEKNLKKNEWFITIDYLEHNTMHSSQSSNEIINKLKAFKEEIRAAITSDQAALPVYAVEKVFQNL